MFAWMWECEGCVGERNDCPRKRGVKEGGSFSVRACILCFRYCCPSTGFRILNSQSTGTKYLLLSPDALSLPMSMCLCPVLYLFLSISFSVSLFLSCSLPHTPLVPVPHSLCRAPCLGRPHSSHDDRSIPPRRSSETACPRATLLTIPSHLAPDSAPPV